MRSIGPPEREEVAAPRDRAVPGLESSASSASGAPSDGRRWALLAGAAVLACVDLIDAELHLDGFGSLASPAAAMRAPSALAVLALCGAAASGRRGAGTTSRVGAWLAAAVAFFGGIAGAAASLGGARRASLHVASIGTSTMTAACLVLLALGILLQRGAHRRRVELVALPVVFAAFVALLGDAYGARGLWVFTHARMAPSSAIAMLLLGAWLVSTSESGVVMRELASDRTGGYMARRLLPVALLVPVVLGWLPLSGERSGYYGMSGGATLLVAMNAIALSMAIWWSARVANRLDRERVESARALEEARVERELRDRFVHALAHDLRNPLTTIRLGATRVAAEPSPDERQRARATIERAAQRLDRMIGDLLDAERLRAGEGLPVRRARRDVVAIACDVVRDQEFMHGARFRVDAPNPIYADVDEGALRRVLENLLGNAWKYGDHDAPIELSVRASGGEVALSVHNQGPVIPDDGRARIFEPFARGPRGHEREGWGIGLALVRGLAEAHGGRVEVESSAAAGTTFVVRLPIDAPGG